MKKLFFIIGLCATLPVLAMELIKKEDNLFITQEDNLWFEKSTAWAMAYDKEMIEKNKIPPYNPVHLILQRIDADFNQCNKDLVALIKKNSLQYRLNEYIKIDSDPLIQMRVEQIRQRRGNMQEAQDYIIKTRQSLAQLFLKKKQYNFHFPAFGEERLNFMLRNPYYPINDAAFNDYIAWIIYSYVLAKK